MVFLGFAAFHSLISLGSASSIAALLSPSSENIVDSGPCSIGMLFVVAVITGWRLRGLLRVILWLADVKNSSQIPQRQRAAGAAMQYCL